MALTLLTHMAQRDAAVFRTAETLKQGKEKMDDILESYKDIGVCNCLPSRPAHDVCPVLLWPYTSNTCRTTSGVYTGRH